MKKKIYILISAVILLMALLLIYLFVLNKSTDKTPDDEQSHSVDMTTLGTQITSINNVDTFTLDNKNGNFVFYKSADIWKIKGYENTFNTSVINNIESVFTGLYSTRIIEENAQDLTKYSLNPPIAQASSGDLKINLGSITTDGKYYYVSLNNENTVYMVNSARVECLQYGLNDFIDKSLPKINSDSIQEISIDYKDKDDILIKYDKDNPIAREYSEKNGLATLVMEKPVGNMLVYPYNLQSSILMNLNSLNVSDLVNISPADLSEYGLDKPLCTISLADNENAIIVKIGNYVPDTENSYSYVMINDRPEVFTMEYRALKPFVNASIADFVEKFVSLYQRSKVNRIIIESDKTYKIDFKAEGENDYKEIDGVTKDYRNSYINGVLIDKDTFTNFYELLVGIGFDNMVSETYKNDSPTVTITFELNDGSKDTAQYYDYDSSFYIVNKGNDTSMLVSKQTVRKVINMAENLINK